MTSYYPSDNQERAYGSPYPNQPYGVQAPPYPQQYPTQPQGQPQQWNPEQIWAQANGSNSVASAPHQNNRNSSRSGSPFTAPNNFSQPQGDGERGIGATLAGGAAGGFLGHEFGHSKMATIGGLVAGVIAANALEHHQKKKHHERDERMAYDSGFNNGERREFSRSRGIDDDASYRERDSSYDRESRYEDEEYPMHHHHHHQHHRDEDRDYERDDESYVRRVEYSRDFDDDAPCRDYDYERRSDTHTYRDDERRSDVHNYRDDERYRRDDRY